ncbi:MAG: type II toxin-antitoxin system VapC family toxin [Planctomycetota bacterium]|nr:MAG: type II toxin-antitoxin system VapC family toxin [Planctomycetota bacterium]
MILLDTHIFVWWVDGSPQLTPAQRKHLEGSETSGLGVSVISCWEVAKLVELNRLVLRCPVAKWLEQALAYPGVRLLYLTPRIAVESTQLPGTFHRDPADQIIVATARIRGCPLLTADARILRYPHIKLLA